ncbi:MAG: hypothetical protein ACRDRA_06340 [Pseudonocardiaceae bacterium]
MTATMVGGAYREPGGRVHTPTEVELFLELGSARDFAMGCHELIDLADEQLARLDSQNPVEIAGRAAQALGVPLPLQEHVHRILAETRCG